MTTDDQCNPLEYPDDYLWVRHTDDSLTIIKRGRLFELYHGAIAESAVAQLLVSDRDWRKILVEHGLGNVVIEICEGGPLPEWNDAWLASCTG